MQPHKIVSRDEWLVARKAHLAEEKAFTRARDALSRKRRELPWEKVEKSYVFDGPNGKETLAGLFGKNSQLIVYHFMFGPTGRRAAPVARCSPIISTAWSLTSRNATSPSWSCRARRCRNRGVQAAHGLDFKWLSSLSFVVVSHAPLPQIEAFKRRMGWNFKWVSSFGSDFNYDYQVSFTPEQRANGGVTYNYQQGEFPSEEAPGASVFYKSAAGELFHTYSCYGRGLDILIGAYNFLDLAPKGRDEDGLAYGMAWVRHHDRYDGAVVDPKATYKEPKISDSCCD